MRVVSFNIHHGTVGRRGPVDPQRLGEVCASFDADVIALQEVDQGTWRAKGADLPAVVADACEMAHVFGASRWFPGGRYGNALLVRGAITSSEVVRLPKVPAWRVWQERRTALTADVTIDGLDLWLVCTHLAVASRISGVQLDALVAAIPLDRGPRVLLGDFNRGSAAVEEPLRAIAMARAEHGATFPAQQPRRTIDHVFTSAELDVTSAVVWSTPMSDHAALVVDLAIRPD